MHSSALALPGDSSPRYPGERFMLTADPGAAAGGAATGRGERSMLSARPGLRAPPEPATDASPQEPALSLRLCVPPPGASHERSAARTRTDPADPTASRPSAALAGVLGVHMRMELSESARASGACEPGLAVPSSAAVPGVAHALMRRPGPWVRPPGRAACSSGLAAPSVVTQARARALTHRLAPRLPPPGRVAVVAARSSTSARRSGRGRPPLRARRA